MSETKREKFSTEILKAHNAKRAIHGVPPLVTSKKLTLLAESWAKKLALEINTFYYNPTTKFGENIYIKYSPDAAHRVNGKGAVNSWYREIRYHHFNKEPTDTKAGHFTQLVWKNTVQLGAARERSPSGRDIVVAYYNPPGNITNEFQNNVLPPQLFQSVRPT